MTSTAASKGVAVSLPTPAKTSLTRWALLTVMIVVGAANACGNDEGATPAPADTRPAAASPATSLGSMTQPEETVSQPPAADMQAVSAAFTSFFDGAVQDVDEKVGLLEHGDELRSTLEGAVANPQFAQMSTKVNAVRLLDDASCAAAEVPSPCAEVDHDLLVGQFPAVADNVGHAVKVGNDWKVAAETWCRIVTIGGATCPPW
jgi:hypothetical protein